MTPTSSVAPAAPGPLAAAAIAALGAGATVCDLYGAQGAPVYHDIAGRDTHEVREILAAIASFPGEVLDLAAGSGRLTLPMLALGRTVTAVDLSADMLDLLNRRLAAAPASWRERCTVVRADLRTFELGRRFPSIVLGTTSISLLDRSGRSRLAERVRRHLAPGGAFVLTTVDLDPATDGTGELELRVQGASGATYRMFESVDTDRAHRRISILPDHQPDSALAFVCMSTIALLPAEQLIAEFEADGLRLRRRRPAGTGLGRLRSTLLELAVSA